MSARKCRAADGAYHAARAVAVRVSGPDQMSTSLSHEDSLFSPPARQRWIEPKIWPLLCFREFIAARGGSLPSSQQVVPMLERATSHTHDR